MAEYLAVALRSAGCDVVNVDSQWNVLAETKGTSAARSLLFLLHMDSVPAGIMEDPFAGKVVDGAQFNKEGQVVYGRGACAPKAAIAAILEALSVLQELGVLDHTKILVAAVTKDLRANHDGVRELDEAYSLRADLVVGGETTDNHIELGARGIARYEVRLHGHPAHLGRPTAANPLYALAQLLISLEHIRLPTHPDLGSATLAPYEVMSEGSSPRTPHLAKVLLDRRLLPGETAERVRQDLQELVDQLASDRRGISGDVTLRGGMQPFQVSDESSGVQLLQRAARAALGHTLPTMHATHSSNVAYLVAERNLPGLAFGPGRIEDVNDTEHVEITRVLEAALVYAALCVVVSAQPERYATDDRR
ncbi:MAG TPA: M20/M25/M40 family metallo-hydrolase [bacterium]|jgi:acetylornithine deacetylase/succinyl-diaminopimelate desuccinylase-like protein|nr:M20/M25/M40 family metallo-hydrolase [bacterium]